jgi:hypothetical protein
MGRAESEEPLAEWKSWPDSELHPAKGSVCGMVVDRTTGDLFAAVKPYRAELWKSTDQGKSFVALKGVIGGLPINSYSFCADPAGKRLACFFAYGGGMVTDGGARLTKFGTIIPAEAVHCVSMDISRVNRNCFELGVVDWEATGTASLAMTHETHGVLLLSTDSGATWKVLGEDFTLPVGIFNPQTLLAGNCKIGLRRSTDGGATWTKVCDLPKTSLSSAYAAEGTSIIVYRGAGYLLTENGLLLSRDKGATWTNLGAPIRICRPPNKFRASGPFFGADEKHILLVGMDGVFQTASGGANWRKVAPYPSNDPAFPPHSCFAWDPVHNIAYAARAGKPGLLCQLPSH